MVRSAGHGAQAYAQALRQAERACEIFADVPDWLAVLGLAQYRAGQHGSAVETLQRSDQRHVSQHGVSRPDVWAVTAMIHHARGAHDEARSALQKAADLLQEPQWQESEMQRGLLREAEEMTLGEDRFGCRELADEASQAIFVRRTGFHPVLHT